MNLQHIVKQKLRISNFVQMQSRNFLLQIIYYLIVFQSFMDQRLEEKKNPMLSEDNNVSKSEERKRKQNAKFNRTLQYHDLDALLVYEKRSRKTIQEQPPKTIVNSFKKEIKKEKPKNNIDHSKTKKIKQKLKINAKIKIKDQNTSTMRNTSLACNLIAQKIIQQVPQKITLLEQPLKQIQKKSEDIPILDPPEENLMLAEEQDQRQNFESDKQKKNAIGSTEINLSQKSQQKNNFSQNIENIKTEIQTYGKKKKFKSKQPRRKKFRKESLDSEEYEQLKNYKFPYSNLYINNITEQYFSHLTHMDNIKDAEQGSSLFPSRTFINCDVKYFNWEFFVDKIGSYEIIMIDPPWRIKGAQQNDSQFMFSNCKFSLEYNTMSNNDILNLNIDKLSNNGFIFLWILNTQLDSTLQILNKWGYEVIDQIIWVKLRDEKIYLTHGYYFMHSYEMCLIGYKKHPTKQIQCIPKVSNNILFAEVRKKSQKPDDLYNMIEMMFPGMKKIEIFARNNNLRFGWFSLGNQLGESYDKWLLTLHCDKCNFPIKPKIKRYKSKKEANYDLCEKCITQNIKDEFFEIQNQADEDIIHPYRSCNKCQIEPIWGPRFQCKICQNFDLCENCYDLNLEQQHRFHDIDHEFIVVEIPIFGHGFNIHDVKCNSCYQKPLIGICFGCRTCKNFNLCQKCFFEKSLSESYISKSHKADHIMEAIFDPSTRIVYKKFECFSCTKQIIQNCWMCENCYNFYFCESCYQKKDQFKTMMANSHKSYHHYLKVF